MKPKEKKSRKNTTDRESQSHVALWRCYHLKFNVANNCRNKFQSRLLLLLACCCLGQFVATFRLRTFKIAFGIILCICSAAFGFGFLHLCVCYVFCFFFFLGFSASHDELMQSSLTNLSGWPKTLRRISLLIVRKNLRNIYGFIGKKKFQPLILNNLWSSPTKTTKEFLIKSLEEEWLYIESATFLFPLWHQPFGTWSFWRF